MIQLMWVVRGGGREPKEVSVTELLQDMNVLDLIGGLEEVESRGNVSPQAVNAFWIRFVLGDGPNSERLHAICNLPFGSNGDVALVALIDQVEVAWQRLQGNGREAC